MLKRITRTLLKDVENLRCVFDILVRHKEFDLLTKLIMPLFKTDNQLELITLKQFFATLPAFKADADLCQMFTLVSIFLSQEIMEHKANEGTCLACFLIIMTNIPEAIYKKHLPANTRQYHLDAVLFARYTNANAVATLVRLGANPFAEIQRSCAMWQAMQNMDLPLASEIFWQEMDINAIYKLCKDPLGYILHKGASPERIKWMIRAGFDPNRYQSNNKASKNLDAEHVILQHMERKQPNL
ncbi:MAG: hypothetical protein M3R00_05465 [Pseudomonadota bacterium]|nr:hypothetical protein [Pseudomonadota bacterium]